jgi:uncharacterized protein
VYDIHLKDFLVAWLPNGKFSTNLKKHLDISDAEVLSAIRRAYEKPSSSQHKYARRIQCREHFRRFFEAAPDDIQGGKLQPGKAIAEQAAKEFGEEAIRYDYIRPKAAAPIFPVLTFDGNVDSSLKRSQILARMPEIGVDNVYCDPAVRADAIKWRDKNKSTILGL